MKLLYIKIDCNFKKCLYFYRLATVAQVLIAVAILFTFGLQFYVPMDILWRKISHKFAVEKHNMTQIYLRTGIMLIMGGIAAAVPDLEPFIGLVGAVFFSVLGKQKYIFNLF